MQTSRTIRIILLTLLISALVIGAFGAGVGVTWLLMHGWIAPADESSEFGVFWEAWRLVEERFLGDLPDAQHMTWGAIRGAYATLNDPYTMFLEPQPTQRRDEDLSGEFGGIGAYVSQAEDGSILLNPMPDLPAEQAGVQDGDVIVMVDDILITAEMSVDDVVNLVRGEVGTTVRLTLRREGDDEPLVVEIKRQKIPTPSVEWRMLEGVEAIGYVRILSFTGRTDRELRDALDELRKAGMSQLVVDLRGNGGGLFDSAIDVASEFLSDGVVAYQVEKDGKQQTYEAKRGGRYTTGPLALLVDGGTASASEIVAGALQDTERAVLVGERTFGKGAVQSLHDLSDGSSVHITFAQWLTPNRRQIDGQGLPADLEVIMTDDDRSQQSDPQLDRAIEYLTIGS